MSIDQLVADVKELDRVMAEAEVQAQQLEAQGREVRRIRTDAKQKRQILIAQLQHERQTIAKEESASASVDAAMIAKASAAQLEALVVQATALLGRLEAQEAKAKSGTS